MSFGFSFGPLPGCFSSFLCGAGGSEAELAAGRCADVASGLPLLPISAAWGSCGREKSNMRMQKMSVPLGSFMDEAENDVGIGIVLTGNLLQ